VQVQQLLPLLPELTRAGIRRVLAPFHVWWRRGWIYRRILKGPLADHIVFYPWDALPRRLEEADSLLRGRFRFYGQTVDVPDGFSVYDLTPPNAAWHEALHSFAWLPALSTAGGDGSRRLATNLIGQWVTRYSKYSEPVWASHIMARRLAHIFSHGRLVILNSEIMWRSRLFVSLREQCRMLERISAEAPDGLPRLEAAAVLALSGLCLDDSRKRLETGMARLEAEIERQILPDGGHVSRSPEALLSAYRHVIMVMEALSAVDQEPPHALRNAHDRIAPMLRFFRHADGALALFNGGAEGDPRMIAGLLARDDIRGQPFHHARHSAYQRLAAGRTLCLLDCGKTPPGAFAIGAHAGAGAFELSSGNDRIVVNCGAGGLTHQAWNAALRATAAHSTLTLSDTSSAHILPAGIARDLARELRGEGIEVDCLPAGEVRDVSPYEGVVLGSGVFLLRRASDGQGCLPRHAVALRDRRLWLFAAGPLGRTAPRLQREPLGASTARQADAESPLVQVARRVGTEGTAIFGTSRAETLGPGESRMRERERVRGWARAIASQLETPRTH